MKSPNPARDTVTVSFDAQRLCSDGDAAQIEKSIPNARVYHLLDLFSITLQKAPAYVVVSQNCWFFTDAIFNAATRLERVTPWKYPRRKVPGMAADIANAIQDKFVDHWIEKDSVFTPYYWGAPRLIPVGVFIASCFDLAAKSEVCVPAHYRYAT